MGNTDYTEIGMPFDKERECYVPKITSYKDFDSWMKNVIIPSAIERLNKSGNYIWLGTPKGGRKDMITAIRKWIKYNKVTPRVENVIKVVEEESYS